jgi:hypothetical protein
LGTVGPIVAADVADMNIARDAERCAGHRTAQGEPECQPAEQSEVQVPVPLRRMIES